MYRLRHAGVGLLAVSTALAVLATSGVGAAQARTVSAGAALTHPAAHRPFLAGANSNWGGYAVTGAKFTKVTGNWVVPSLKCSVTSGDISFWSGLDGWTSATVEQIGLDAVCTSGGSIQYNPWVEMFPAGSIYFKETVKAGDKMTSSVTTAGSGSFTLVLADPTQGWTKKFVKTRSGAKLNSAEVIVEAIGSQNIPPCPDFGAVDFSDVTANGKSFSSAGSVQSTNLERNGVFLTHDGALSGTSFPVTWLHK